jgi:hypothetical protein
LGREIEIDEGVAVDVGNRNAIAMIVMCGFVGLTGIVDDAVSEGDAALGDAIYELESVEDAELARGAELLSAPQREPRVRILQLRWYQSTLYGNILNPGGRGFFRADGLVGT